ncbi:E1 ubiquitin-activating protein aos1, partial [Linderina pennispora]
MSNDTKSISKEEVALYDRQIRLWGMEAQTRLRNASILIIGVKSLTLEASKNLVLAGIGHLTLSDSSPVTETDLISAYYCYEADVGKRKDEQLSERLKILNPLVDIEARTVGDDELQLFDMVVVVGQSFEVAKRINSVCRRNGVKMVVADAFGLFGFAFADCLEQHEFVVETKKVEGKTGEPETKREKKAIPYVTLEASLGKSFGMPVRRMRRVMSPLIIIYQ